MPDRPRKELVVNKRNITMANKPGFLVTLRSYALSLGEFIVVGVVFVVALFGALFFMMAPPWKGPRRPLKGMRTYTSAPPTRKSAWSTS